MKRYILAALALLLVLAIVAIVAFGVWYAVTDEADRDARLDDLGISSSDDTLMGSGFVEATMLDLASELGGRVAEVHVREGDPVEAGAVLLVLEDDTLLAERRQAEASLAAAEAQLAQIQEGARPQQLRQAELGAVRARAAAEGAEQAWDDARAALKDLRGPSSLVTAAEAELATARDRLRAAEALFASADDQRTQLEAGAANAAGALSVAGAERLAEARSGWWDAWAARESARIVVEGAEAHLDAVQRMRDEPLELQMRADAAQMQHEIAHAGLAVAEANRDLAEAGPVETDIAMVEAAVLQAQARLSAVDAKLDLLRIRAPMDGTVIDIPVSVGELAAPGRILVRVGELDPVTLTIYAPEAAIGRLGLGLPAEIEVDALDDHVFDGRVIAIASEAEFTPKNVQTKDERATLVYAVTIEIPNAEDFLKAGMPADAEIELEVDR
jgi:multidrug efflux pump subunit AcrA (membrane-fusion protein)